MNLSMINQARQLKAKLDEAQKELSQITVEGESGKGAVRVTVNGQQKIVSIKISPEVIDPGKPENLEQLILQAIGDATARSQKIAAKRLGKVTGGLRIPGLM